MARAHLLKSNQASLLKDFVILLRILSFLLIVMLMMKGAHSTHISFIGAFICPIRENNQYSCILLQDFSFPDPNTMLFYVAGKEDLCLGFTL